MRRTATWLGVFGLAALVSAASAALGEFAAPEEPARGEFVVHEWGTFTSVSGADGASLDWRPLSGPSDLPSFVYGSGSLPRGLRHGVKCPKCDHYRCTCGDTCAPSADGRCDRCKTCAVGNVRMETPVLYFYTATETTVDVDVRFPGGRITEWYPQAREVADGITWGGVRLLPGASVALPTEPSPSHYYPARAVDACPIRVCGRAAPEFERFLFYRGVGTFTVPLRVRPSADVLHLEPASDTPVAEGFVFERAGDRVGWSRIPRVDGATAVARPPLGTEEPIGPALARTLVAAGLYPKEADAMLATWNDSWFEEGLRVLYLVPRAVTDAVLPLRLDPAPRALVRVLVGRIEVLTPEMETAMAGAVDRLGASDPAVREAAQARLARYGRFAEPLLRRVLTTTADAEVAVRIRRLLG